MDALRRAGVTALLAVVYLLIVIPVGCALRLWRDPLDRAPRPRARTYWTRHRA
ncbi:hypothetical protein AB0N81_21420 [Streptomyces sp. NPDC093510]|uniref:hypothetical protein n=1 Tax=Streptomyces sp. NPDC093510 TaxID=3155199 RepID=UPI00341DD3A1